MQIITFSTPSFLFLTLWTISPLRNAGVVYAHVVMVHPTPRTNNDYLYTFDNGVCNPETGKACSSFCGEPYEPDKNPVTILPVGVPTTLRWKTNVAHYPYQYRLSLNPMASDDNFDLNDNILTTVSNADAADSGNAGQTGSFSTTVTIPESMMETCSHEEGDEPCVLQLWDVYYFVSCANVLLTAEEEVGDQQQQEELAIETPAIETLPPLPKQSNNTILFQGASFQDYRVTNGHKEPELDPILYLERCKEYTFVVDAPGHPFLIKTQPTLGEDDLLDFDNSTNFFTASNTYPTMKGMERGSFTFQAGSDVPSSTNLYYQCTLHDGMGSQIVIVDGDCSRSSQEDNGTSDDTKEATTETTSELDDECQVDSDCNAQETTVCVEGTCVLSEEEEEGPATPQSAGTRQSVRWSSYPTAIIVMWFVATLL